MSKRLTTVDAVIDHLGGINRVAEMTGRTPNQVYNWRHQDRFGSAVYLLMQQQLWRSGATASPRLWGIETKRRATVAA